MKNLMIISPIILLMGCGLPALHAAPDTGGLQYRDIGAMGRMLPIDIENQMELWPYGERQVRVAERIGELHPEIDPEKAREYAGIFIKYSDKYDLDVNMVVHIAYIESRFEENIISRTGDYGLMQINWRSHHARLTPMGVTQETLLDPEINVDYGCEILSIFAERSNSLYGIIRRFAPYRPRYYTQRLEQLMAESNI